MPKPDHADKLRRITEVEQTVEGVITTLEAKEEITADDLEALRRSLPTDPTLAKLVKSSLPYPLSELFEYVQASDRQSAYWRVTHDRRANRSPADRKHKERFSEAAKETQGLEGTVEYDRREIPASAAHVAETVTDAEGNNEPANQTGHRAQRRLLEILKLESTGHG